MKVIISCCGKFHAFHLAEQLDKLGCLHKLITPYYSQKDKWLLNVREDKEKINTGRVVTNVALAILHKIFSKFSGLNYYYLQNFDDWAKKQIDECDLFVGWSGYSLDSLQKAKSIGAVTVLERCSSHILFQKEILEEEYNKYDIGVEPVDEQVAQKELDEYKEADFISIPSTFVWKTFIEKGIKKEKLIHVPYGVDLSSFKKMPKEDNVFRIVFIGGLTLRKGVHYLLEAYSQLKLKNTELLLIGGLSSEFKPFLKRYEGNYRYVGIIPHLELYKYLSQGSVFVLPSIEEGLAYVIPQAMAGGLPVICTTNTGGGDIVQDSIDGFVIPIRNVEKLKEKIVFFYKNQDACREMGESAQKRVSSGFTWDDYGEKIINVYKNLIKNSNVN